MKTRSQLLRKYDFIRQNLDYKGLYTPINRVYFQKIIYYGNYIDTTTYKKIMLSYKNENRSFTRNPQTRSDRSIQRFKENLHRLVQANVDHYRTNVPVFATLTYARNEQHIPTAYSDYRAFIKRLNYETETKLQYVAVPEFQERGAIHFHIIFFNLPFIRTNTFEQIWGFGYTNLQACKEIKAAATYLFKYITKENLQDGRLLGKRVLLSSRGLMRPTLSFDSHAFDILLTNGKIELISTYENKQLSKDNFKFI